MCFSYYRTYIMILCNWFILDKMHFTCIWIDLGCVKILQETTFQDQVLKPSSLFKKSSKSVNSLKLDNWSIPAQHLLSVEI